jgi:hypothetical protein
VLGVAGIAQSAPVRRVVGIEAEPYQLAAAAWVVVGDGGRAEALRPVTVDLVVADAERVASEYAGPEPLGVGSAVAALVPVTALLVSGALVGGAAAGGDEGGAAWLGAGLQCAARHPTIS